METLKSNEVYKLGFTSLAIIALIGMVVCNVGLKETRAVVREQING